MNDINHVIGMSINEHGLSVSIICVGKMLPRAKCILIMYINYPAMMRSGSGEHAIMFWRRIIAEFM